MTLRNWFASKRKTNSSLNPDNVNLNVSDDELERLWTQCYNCSERFPTKEIEDNLMVCSACGYHFRVGAWERIHQLTDSFEEMDSDLRPQDPLAFTDTEPYIERIRKAEEKSELKEAVVSGIGKIRDIEFALAVMDFSYLGGSMGSVVGEKITRLIEKAIGRVDSWVHEDTDSRKEQPGVYTEINDAAEQRIDEEYAPQGPKCQHALERNLSLVIVSSSGGARMQEGTFSLMQMVKTGSALAKYHEAGLLYISILTEPTFGGVTASYGTLGDIIIAENGARIGFAGRRVIEQTIRQKLPPDFQTANYLLKYGQVDMVLNRHQLKNSLYNLINLHQRSLDIRGCLRSVQDEMITRKKC